MDVKFEELEKETKRFLTKRMKYISVEEKAHADRKANRAKEMAKLKAQLWDVRTKIKSLQDDPSRNDDLTQSRIEEDQYEQRLAELQAEEIDEEENYESSKDQIAAFGDPALLGISEEELDEQCEERAKVAHDDERTDGDVLQREHR